MTYFKDVIKRQRNGRIT